MSVDVFEALEKLPPKNAFARAGETWNFKTDRIIISDKTHTDQWSGGGYGNTIEVVNNGKRHLVSVYSWRDSQQDTRVEAVRWALP